MPSLHAACVLPDADQLVADVVDVAHPCELEPQIEILAECKRLVEAAHLKQSRPAGHHCRGRSRKRISLEKIDKNVASLTRCRKVRVVQFRAVFVDCKKSTVYETEILRSRAEHGHLTFDLVMLPDIVAVYECNKFGRGCSNPFIPRMRQTARLCLDQPNSCDSFRVAGHDLRGFVPRAVVNDQHALDRTGLRQYAIETGTEEARSITNRYDDVDRGLRALRHGDHVRGPGWIRATKALIVARLRSSFRKMPVLGR